MKEETYLETFQREFRHLRHLADAAIEQLDERELFATTGPGDNSVAIIMKHMAGNMLSRWTDFLASDGEKPDRNRDAEFTIHSADTREALLERWRNGWRCLLDALSGLRQEDLAKTVVIRGEPHSVHQAINRQLTHYAYHTGQIVLLAKSLTGPRWRTLSIARGRSEAFNASPKAYLDGDA